MKNFFRDWHKPSSWYKAKQKELSYSPVVIRKEGDGMEVKISESGGKQLIARIDKENTQSVLRQVQSDFPSEDGWLKFDVTVSSFRFDKATAPHTYRLYAALPYEATKHLECIAAMMYDVLGWEINWGDGRTGFVATKSGSWIEYRIKEVS